MVWIYSDFQSKQVKSCMNPMPHGKTLIALACALLMINVDYTAVNLALVQMAADLNSNLNTMQWALSAYVLAWAAVIILSGKLADKYGHYRFCLLGLAIFTLASCVAGLAQSTSLLIAGRALQGIAGGLFVPAMYVLIHQVFPENKRGLAVGVMSLGVGLGLAIGPMLGGLLLVFLGWRSIFFINLPIGVLTLGLLWQEKPKIMADSVIQPIHKTSASLLGVGLVVLFLVINNWQNWSQASVSYFGLLVVAAGCLGVFIRLQQRLTVPFLPIALFQNKAYAGCLLALLIEQYYFACVVVVSGIYLQKILTYPVLTTSLLYLPLTVLFGIIAVFGGVWIDRIGVRKPAFIGLLIMAAGCGLFALLPAQRHIAWIVLTFIVMGAGLGLAFSALNAGVVKLVRAEQVGIASSVFVMTALVGNSLGVAATVFMYEKLSQVKLFAMLNAVMSEFSQVQLQQLHQAIVNIGASRFQLDSFSAGTQQMLQRTIPNAMNSGLTYIMLTSGILCVLAAWSCLRLLRPTPPVL